MWCLVNQAVLGVLGKCWSDGWFCWPLRTVVSSTADGLRTFAGTLPPFPISQAHQDGGR